MQIIKKFMLSVALVSLITSPLLHANDAIALWNKPENRVFIISGAAVCAALLALIAWYNFSAHKKVTPPSSTHIPPAPTGDPIQPATSVFPPVLAKEEGQGNGQTSLAHASSLVEPFDNLPHTPKSPRLVGSAEGADAAIVSEEEGDESDIRFLAASVLVSDEESDDEADKEVERMKKTPAYEDAVRELDQEEFDDFLEESSVTLEGYDKPAVGTESAVITPKGKPDKQPEHFRFDTLAIDRFNQRELARKR
ncbi:MAG: hypothetical protein ACHQVS_04005 [Candidatus Babeliales bacterium]